VKCQTKKLTTNHHINSSSIGFINVLPIFPWIHAPLLCLIYLNTIVFIVCLINRSITEKLDDTKTMTVLKFLTVVTVVLKKYGERGVNVWTPFLGEQNDDENGCNAIGNCLFWLFCW
jgi:hypothetical protein